MRKLLMAIAFLSLAGCATGQMMAQSGDPCADYGSLRGSVRQSEADALRQELINRAAITPTEWPKVDARTPAIGMSKCAVLAMFGPPTVTNQIATPHGLQETLAFRRPYESAATVFVTFDNGKAVGVQQ
jgi:hypothetical protein